MAPSGQADSQAAQSMHFSASIEYLGSPFTMASDGQVSKQVPHALHFSLIL